VNNIHISHFTFLLNQRKNSSTAWYPSSFCFCVCGFSHQNSCLIFSRPQLKEGRLSREKYENKTLIGFHYYFIYVVDETI